MPYAAEFTSRASYDKLFWLLVLKYYRFGTRMIKPAERFQLHNSILFSGILM